MQSDAYETSCVETECGLPHDLKTPAFGSCQIMCDHCKALRIYPDDERCEGVQTVRTFYSALPCPAKSRIVLNELGIVCGLGLQDVCLHMMG